MDGRTINQATTIDLMADTGFCMIQTDKGMYKRSQTGRFFSKLYINNIVCIENKFGL